MSSEARIPSFPSSARRLLYGAAWIYALSKLAQSVFFETHIVRGPSMAPTLSPGYKTTGDKDIIHVSKFRARQNLKRGDVVVYWKPHNPEELVVKRVIAIGGDTVFRDVRRVGMEATRRDEGGVSEAVKRGFADLGPIVKIPYGHMWVEGDNWRESLDSNDYGPVSSSLIVGKAVARVWPWARAGGIPGVQKGNKNFPMTKVVQGEARLPQAWEG